MCHSRRVPDVITSGITTRLAYECSSLSNCNVSQNIKCHYWNISIGVPEMIKKKTKKKKTKKKKLNYCISLFLYYTLLYLMYYITSYTLHYMTRRVIKKESDVRGWTALVLFEKHGPDVFDRLPIISRISPKPEMHNCSRKKSRACDKHADDFISRIADSREQPTNVVHVLWRTRFRCATQRTITCSRPALTYRRRALTTEMMLLMQLTYRNQKHNGASNITGDW